MPTDQGSVSNSEIMTTHYISTNLINSTRCMNSEGSRRALNYDHIRGTERPLLKLCLDIGQAMRAYYVHYTYIGEKKFPVFFSRYDHI